jgi:hypothetical protein
MNKKNDQPHKQTPLSDEHQTTMVLLDGYATDILTAQEKKGVEQHLTSCQECQCALRDISRLHTFIGLPDTVIHASQLYEASTLPMYKRGISRLADSVLDTIAQTNREEATPTSNPPIAQWRPSRLTKSHSKKIRIGLLVGGVATSICAIALGILWLAAMRAHGSQTQTTAYAGTWLLHQDQTPVIQQGQNVFAVEYVPIMDNRDFDFIYAYRSSQPEAPPHVNVISMIPGQATSSITINSTVQPLGMLGDFEIGEIHAHMPNRVGQSIIVQGTFPDQTTPWHLTICDQNVAFSSTAPPYMGTEGGLLADQGKEPEVTAHWSNYLGGIGKSQYRVSNTHGYTHIVGLISFTLTPQPKMPTTTAQMYVRMDYLWKDAIVKATVISQAEYQSLEGPQPTPFAGPRPTPINPDQLRKEYDATARAQK